MVVLLAVLLAIIVVLGVESLAVMWLWNYLSPSVIPLVDISFWQALALTLLSSLLFGNIFKSGTGTNPKNGAKTTV